MGWIVPLILVGFPVLEIATFVAMINSIGFLATIALALGGAMLGLMILRNQSLATTWAIRQQLARGEFPVSSVFNSVCLTLSGLLFVFPGFISDGLAILLLIPPLRRGLLLLLSRRTAPRTTADYEQSSPPSTPPPVIEGDYQVLEPDDKR